MGSSGSNKMYTSSLLGGIQAILILGYPLFGTNKQPSISSVNVKNVHLCHVLFWTNAVFGKHRGHSWSHLVCKALESQCPNSIHSNSEPQNRGKKNSLIVLFHKKNAPKLHKSKSIAQMSAQIQEHPTCTMSWRLRAIVCLGQTRIPCKMRRFLTFLVSPCNSKIVVRPQH